MSSEDGKQGELRLDCIVQPGVHPNIRTSPVRRDWMDDTGFANRCLPLKIANSHGWEVLNPSSFSAMWDGGASPKSIQLAGVDGEPAAVSHFGNGVLTFIINGLFSTSDGVSLWIGGPVNRPKSNIYPLTGIVETFWSPYSFTMNWIFIRPGELVHFEAGEPICCFMPIKIDLIERLRPEFVDFADKTKLVEQHRIFVASREKSNATLFDRESVEPKTGWDMGYLKGRLPDGCPGSASHKTRLKLRSFTSRTRHRSKT